jgi:hypothetical protein
MATQSKIVTHAGVALREELDNVITNIDPTETPFISNIGKGKTSSYKTEWLTDTLAAAALNQNAEAATANAAAIGAGARLENYITISAKWFDISDVLESADTAGQLGKISYQTAKALKELSRDMEYTLINEATGSSTDTFKSRGLKYWLGLAHGTNYEGFSATQAVTNLLTEDYFCAAQQKVYDLGGKVDMVLAPSAQKKRISAFNGANRLTVNTDMANKKIMNVVDFIENDFGVARIYIERNILDDVDDYQWVFFLQKDMWKLLTMLPVKVEKLARTGLSQQVQISTTYTLRCGNEKANAAINNLYKL